MNYIFLCQRGSRSAYSREYIEVSMRNAAETTDCLSNINFEFL